jgi:hypothetical protein
LPLCGIKIADPGTAFYRGTEQPVIGRDQHSPHGGKPRINWATL